MPRNQKTSKKSGRKTRSYSGKRKDTKKNHAARKDAPCRNVKTESLVEHAVKYFMFPLRYLQSFIRNYDTAAIPEGKRLSTFAKIVPVVQHGKGVYPLSGKPIDESSSTLSSDEVTAAMGCSDDSLQDRETAASDFLMMNASIDPRGFIDTSTPIKELVNVPAKELNSSSSSLSSHGGETSHDPTLVGELVDVPVEELSSSSSSLSSHGGETRHDPTLVEELLDVPGKELNSSSSSLSSYGDDTRHDSTDDSYEGGDDTYSFSSGEEDELDREVSRIFRNNCSYSSVFDNEDGRASGVQNGRRNNPGHWNRDHHTRRNVALEAEEPNNTTWNPCPGAERDMAKRHEELADGGLRQEFLRNQHAHVEPPLIPYPRDTPPPLWFPYDLEGALLMGRGHHNDSAFSDEAAEMNLMDVAIAAWQDERGLLGDQEIEFGGSPGDQGFEDRDLSTEKNELYFGMWGRFATENPVPVVVIKGPPGFPALPQNPPAIRCHCGDPNCITLPDPMSTYWENARVQPTRNYPPAPPPLRHLYYGYPEFMAYPTEAQQPNEE